LFTVDIYKKLYPKTPEGKLVNIGRVATAIVVVLGIAWIPIMQNISSALYEYLQSVQSYIAPPIAAVFLLGIFFKRINSKGAMATLLGGLLVAILRLTLEINKGQLEPGSFIHTFGTINFLTFAAWFFLFCVVICVTVSMLTKPPMAAQINGLTYSTLSAEQKAANRASFNWVDIVLSLIVIAIVAFVMISFTG
jgi:SSS family solute:Na+ symporter